MTYSSGRFTIGGASYSGTYDCSFAGTPTGQTTAIAGTAMGSYTCTRP